LPAGEFDRLGVGNDEQHRVGLPFEADHDAPLPFADGGHESFAGDGGDAVVERIELGPVGHVANLAVGVFGFHPQLL
jgi:hypothetical protein